MNRARPLLLAGATAGALLLAACGQGSDAAGGAVPADVELMVHTGPGGGSDTFARAAVELLRGEELIEGNWTVVNENGGSGAVAMAALASAGDRDDLVAVSTPTWLTTPLTNAEASVTMDQLTPVVGLITEPTVMAVAADSPYESLEDFIAAAEAEPGGLTQVGGSVTAIDALAAEVIKAETGTQWQYLTFEGGGERIAAVLGGNADMIFAAPAEISEQVRAGELKVIATIGDEPSELFPDAPTLAESGLEGVEVPGQRRGIVGPPDMDEETVAGYAELFGAMVETDAWATYTEENGLTTDFLGPEEWAASLEEQDQLLSSLLERLDLLAAG